MRRVLALLAKVVLFPVRIVFTALVWLVVVLLRLVLALGILFVVAIGAGFAAILLWGAALIVFGLIDLIFYMHINQSIQDFYTSKVEPVRLAAVDTINATALSIDEYAGVIFNLIREYAGAIWVSFLEWCNRAGITELAGRFGAFLSVIGDFLSVILTEFVRVVVLFVLLTLAGLVSYRLRVSRRLAYGIFELLVAFVAMLVAVNGMAGGNFTLGYIIALVSGLYVMIRGLQNVDDGLKAQVEDGASQETGTIPTAYSLFQALFHSPLKTDDWDRIGKASLELIIVGWANLKAIRVWRRLRP
jgi:hypothetical protein